MTLNTYELTSIYKNADTRFQITCILRSAIDRYIPGAFGEDSLVPSCTYIITCITLIYCNVNHVKLLLLMQCFVVL